MISVAVLDDQDLAVAAERAGEQPPPVIGGDDLGRGAGLEGDALARHAERVTLAVARHHLAAGGIDQMPTRAGEGVEERGHARVGRRRRRQRRLDPAVVARLLRRRLGEAGPPPPPPAPRPPPPSPPCPRGPPPAAP